MAKQFILQKKDKIHKPFKRNSDGRWRFEVHRNGTVVHTKSAKTRAKVFEIYDSMVEAQKNISGRYLSVYEPDITLSVIINEWFAWVIGPESPKRIRRCVRTDLDGKEYIPSGYKDDCRYALQHLHAAYCDNAAMHAWDICTMSLQDMIDQGINPLKKLFKHTDLATSTRKERNNKINQICEFLREEKQYRIEKDFFKILNLDNAHDAPKVRKHVTSQDIHKLLHVMQEYDYPYRHFIEFSIEMGTRPNEMFGVTADKIETVEGTNYQTLHINQTLFKLRKVDGNYYMIEEDHTKTTGASQLTDMGQRPIPISDAAQQALRNHQDLEKRLRTQCADHYAEHQQKYITKYGQLSWDQCASKLLFTRLPVFDGQTWRIIGKNLAYGGRSDHPKGDFHGWPLTTEYLNKDVKWLSQLAGIECEPDELFTYRNVRNMMIQQSFEAGIPSATVQKKAGHQNVKTTERYLTERSLTELEVESLRSVSLLSNTQNSEDDPQLVVS